jgi:O-antigen/teichoic acid export membrane protein
VLNVNAHAIITVVLGPAWTYSGTILYYLTFSLFPIAPMNAMGWVFISLDRSARWFRWGLLTSIVFPFAYYAGLAFRSEGVAIAYSFAVLALAIPCIVYAAHNTPISAADVARATRSPLVAAATTLFICFQLNSLWAQLEPLASLAVGGVVTTLIFGLVSIALFFIDSEQGPQRNILISWWRGRFR